MRSPFPGMDPYIESPTHWSDFHATFVPALRETLADKLPDNYYARIDEQVVLLGPELDRPKTVEPDVLVTSDSYSVGTGASGPAGSAVLEPVTLRNMQY